MTGVGVQRWWRPAAAAPAAAPAVPAQAARGTLAFRALVALLLIVVLSPQAFLPALQPLRIAFVAAAIAIGAYLAQRIAARASLVELNREVRIVGLLLAWAVVTVPFSYWPGGSVQFVVGAFAKTLAVFLLIANVVDTRRRFVTVATALAACAVPLALAGIANYVTGDVHADRIIGYESGLAANPNDLALMLNLLLPLAIGLFLGARGIAARGLLAAVVALAMVGVVVTFSRSGFLTLALIGMVYIGILVRRRRHGLAALAVVGALAALPLLPASYVERLATITSIEADESGSSRARWTDSVAAVRLVASNPLVGAGIGQNALAMNDARGDRWLRVHNVYLEVAVELGLPGLLLYGALVWSATGAANRARKAADRSGPADARFALVVEGAWVSLVAFAFAAVFYPVAYSFYFFVFAGLALAARRIVSGARA